MHLGPLETATKRIKINVYLSAFHSIQVWNKKTSVLETQAKRITNSSIPTKSAPKYSHIHGSVLKTAFFFPP